MKKSVKSIVVVAAILASLSFSVFAYKSEHDKNKIVKYRHKTLRSEKAVKHLALLDERKQAARARHASVQLSYPDCNGQIQAKGVTCKQTFNQSIKMAFTQPVKPTTSNSITIYLPPEDAQACFNAIQKISAAPYDNVSLSTQGYSSIYVALNNKSPEQFVSILKLDKKSGSKCTGYLVFDYTPYGQ